MHSSSDHIRKRTVRSARLVDNQINMGAEAATGRTTHTSPAILIQREHFRFRQFSDGKKSSANNDKMLPKYWLAKLAASNQLAARKCPNDAHTETLDCDLLCRLFAVNERRVASKSSFELMLEQMAISERMEQQYGEGTKALNSKNTAIADQSTFRVLKMTSDGE